MSGTATSTSSVVQGSAVGGTATGGTNTQTIKIPVDDAAKTYEAMRAKQDAEFQKHQKSMQKYYFAQLFISIATGVLSLIAYIAYTKALTDSLKSIKRIAEQRDARYSSVFAPCEDKYMAELCGIPQYVPRYADTAARMLQGSNRSFDLAQELALKTRTRYCGGLTEHTLMQIAIARGVSGADAISAAYRYEDAVTDSRNSSRHVKIVSMFQIGQQLSATAMQGFSNAVSGYGQLATRAGASLNNSISGIFAGFGALQNNGNDAAATRGLMGGGILDAGTGTDGIYA